MTADLRAAAVRVLARYGDRLDPQRVADEVLAAVLPGHRRRVLVEAAAVVEGLKPSAPVWGTNDVPRVLALSEAIRTLRGLAAEPVGPDRPRGVAVIEQPITFTAGIDEEWNGDEEILDYFVVLRVGTWRVARWPVTGDERDYLTNPAEMEQYVAHALAAIFRAKVSP